MANWQLVYDNEEDPDDQVFYCTWLDDHKPERMHAVCTWLHDEEVELSNSAALSLAWQLPEIQRLAAAAQETENAFRDWVAKGHLTILGYRGLHQCMELARGLHNALLPLQDLMDAAPTG